MIHDTHFIIIGCIIAFLIGLQIYIFVKNFIQMRAFCRTFGVPGFKVNYSAKKNDNNQVVGIQADFENEYFSRIKDSIDEYMEANAGGTIDFQLIKDAVDRNCDSIEEDCSAQVPLPLYIGLAGTMLGIIVGIGYLWATGQLDTLLDLTQQVDTLNGTNVADGSDGIKTLLSGVAMAMIASILGLTFTTISTWIFKGIKLEVEIGKNSFFTWMQSNLLPEVASDTIDALRKLGRTLGTFNKDFAKNSEAFGQTMTKILGVNSTQNELLTNVKTMNTEIEEMSKRNLAVANRLSGVMSVLNDFTNYIQSINGYTTSLQNFTTMFNSEADRLHVLEAMKEFFDLQGQRLKEREDTLKKGMGKLDNALLEGTGQLKNRFNDSNDELKKLMIQQKEQFKTLLTSQTNMFEDAHKTLIESMKSELSALPQTVAAINVMPEKINALLTGYKKENDKLVEQLSRSLSTMNHILVKIGVSGAVVKGKDGETVIRHTSVFPKWMNYVIVTLVGVMAFACVANTYFGYKSYNKTKYVSTEELPVDTLVADSVVTTPEAVQQPSNHNVNTNPSQAGVQESQKPQQP
jgi:hypothetical protein